jgi:hypothetical protein
MKQSTCSVQVRHRRLYGRCLDCLTKDRNGVVVVAGAGTCLWHVTNIAIQAEDEMPPYSVDVI